VFNPVSVKKKPYTMPPTLSTHEEKPRSFWHRYAEKVRESGIKPPFHQWMVKRSEHYIAAHTRPDGVAV
jgi:hypothetical protein